MARGGQWVERGGMAQGCVGDQTPPSGARGQARSIICRPRRDGMARLGLYGRAAGRARVDVE